MKKLFAVWFCICGGVALLSWFGVSTYAPQVIERAYDGFNSYSVALYSMSSPIDLVANYFNKMNAQKWVLGHLPSGIGQIFDSVILLPLSVGVSVVNNIFVFISNTVSYIYYIFTGSWGF